MNDIEKNNSVLQHFGIMGMHWGSKRGSTSTPGSADHNKKVSLNSKKIHEMSNDELKFLTQRATLEKQYKEIKKNQIHPAKKFINDFIAAQAKTALNQYASIYTKRLVDKLASRTISTS